MKFINREQELKALNQAWKNNGFQFFVVYGKRRVGKTELIKQFSSDKAQIYFLAKQTAEKDNLKSLGYTVGQTFKDQFIMERGFLSWREVFVYLRQNIKKKTVVAIDEFPYLIEANKGMPSIWQKACDEYFKKMPLFLILCGSSIGMMEQEVLGYKSPLYGRRTGQLFVQPLTYQHAFKFFPKNFNFSKSLEYFTVVGGIPSYLLKINKYQNLRKAIQNEILKPEAFLYQEVDFILKEELREPRNYFSILKAIAQGKAKFSEIANEVGLEKSALHNYLFVLEDLHLIKKEVPALEKNPLKSRKGLYFICDPFFKFWFNYVFPYKSELALLNSMAALHKWAESFNQFAAQVYERAAQDILRGMQEIFFPFERVGRFWDKDLEIDLIACNSQENKILFGEVKWSNKLVGVNVYQDLKEKAWRVNWGKLNNRQEYFVLFSKAGFTQGMLGLSKKERVVLIKGDKLL